MLNRKTIVVGIVCLTLSSLSVLGEKKLGDTTEVTIDGRRIVMTHVIDDVLRCQWETKFVKECKGNDDGERSREHCEWILKTEHLCDRIPKKFTLFEVYENDDDRKERIVETINDYVKMRTSQRIAECDQLKNNKTEHVGKVILNQCAEIKSNRKALTDVLPDYGDASLQELPYEHEGFLRIFGLTCKKPEGCSDDDESGAEWAYGGIRIDVDLIDYHFRRRQDKIEWYYVGYIVHERLHSRDSRVESATPQSESKVRSTEVSITKGLGAPTINKEISRRSAYLHSGWIISDSREND